MTIAEQITGRMSKASFFYEKDPRKSGEPVVPEGYHHWFPYKQYKHVNATVWVDCCFGYYALSVGNKVIGVGKDMVISEKWVLLGESYGELILGQRVKADE